MDDPRLKRPIPDGDAVNLAPVQCLSERTDRGDAFALVHDSGEKVEMALVRVEIKIREIDGTGRDVRPLPS